VIIHLIQVNQHFKGFHEFDKLLFIFITDLAKVKYIMTQPEWKPDILDLFESAFIVIGHYVGDLHSYGI